MARAGEGAAMGRRLLVVSAILLSVVSRHAARAQTSTPADTAAFMKALMLESDGKFKEAVPLYRASLHGPEGQNAFLGLERVLAELGWTDSLLAPLDTLLRD